MYALIITLDYELPAGGTGDVREHITEPTARLATLCEAYGAKLTVLVEMGELWAFRDPENAAYKEFLGYDPASEIEEQLRDLVRRGHDVQLHLHPQWIGALWREGHWQLDYARYRLTDFDEAEAAGLLLRARKDLEGLLCPVQPGYECVGFRAGHWNTHPSDKYLRVLSQAGLQSDTSVFKGGHTVNDLVHFDYREAHSNLEAWYADASDINRPARNAEGILECPIASVPSSVFGMLTPRRLGSLLRSRRAERSVHIDVPRREHTSNTSRSGAFGRVGKMFRSRAKKLDFCKLSAGEMKHVVKRLIAQSESAPNQMPKPIVMIGHSKDIEARPELAQFLSDLPKISKRIAFRTYQDFVSGYHNERS